jgi:hypothetical protein
MFDPTVKNQPTDEKRRNACRTWLMGLIATGKFFITNLLMEDEPFRTLGLECMDGVVVDSGKPTVAEVVLREDELVTSRPVRLVAIKNDGSTVAYDPNGQIKIRRQFTEVVPGTNHTRKVTKDVPLGKDATLSHLEARKVLVASGWPMKDNRSKGNRRGTVVEWEWLKVEATLPTASKEVIDLHASIRDALEPVAPAASAHKSKGAESRV